MTNTDQANTGILKRISNFPFNPAKVPFYYGWMILLWGTIGVVLSVPGQTVGVSVFTDPLIEAFSIERIGLTVAYGIGTMLSAFFITYAGKFYDRFGARISGSITALAFGLVLIGLGHAFETVNYLVKVTGLNSKVVSIVNLTIGFFLLRFFGQGVLTMVSRNMVMKWFDKSRGFANAIHSIVVAFTFSYAPKIFSDMIDASSWSQTWVLLGIIVGGGFFILIWIFYRDNPQNSGLNPDGKFIIQIGKKIDHTTSAINYRLKEARKTRIFWAYTLTLSMSSLLITAITFHIISLFETGGYSKEIAVSAFLPMAIVSVTLNFFGSWLADYIKLSIFLFIHIFGMILAAISVFLIEQNLDLGINMLILGNGISSGMFGILITLTWPRFFGTKYLGEISGFAMSFLVAGSAIGPFLFSGSQVLSGNYNLASIFSIIVLIGIAILSIKIRNINTATVK